MYKLRSKIEIAETELSAFAIFGDVQKAIHAPDPRALALGTRLLLPAGETPTSLSEIPFEAYDRLRTTLAVPDGSRDMEVGKAILLENNIDLLNGIAWDKGCYTGQELTARTKYRGLIKKRLMPVKIDGPVPHVGTPLVAPETINWSATGRNADEQRKSWPGADAVRSRAQVAAFRYRRRDDHRRTDDGACRNHRSGRRLTCPTSWSIATRSARGRKASFNGNFALSSS